MRLRLMMIIVVCVEALPHLFSSPKHYLLPFQFGKFFFFFLSLLVN
ncbi:hypothetical protein GYH30_036639 [Glycine max]|nr:hypothetical protein GYH30_036639 [Glycine max]